MPPEMTLPPAVVRSSSHQAEVPEGPRAQSSSASSTAELLSEVSGIDPSEEYSRDERLLNEFIKMHPMLS